MSSNPSENAENTVNMIEVASISTRGYKEVIEVRVPVRFYWSKDDSFDGIEFGEFKTVLLPWQENMICRCLEAVSPALGSREDESTDEE